ncbi:MAG: dihydroorotase [Alphaproteobacteria bacterium]|nr:dihydroorotase [Alphaproteobacteria bacterium]
MTGKVAYINARVIDPASGFDAVATRKGGVLTDGAHISAIGPDIFTTGTPDNAEIVDCKGAALTPGLVDMRVDFCEPGNEHKEDIESGSRAAAAGGVTAVVTLPDTAPAIDNASVLEFVARRAREVKLVKVFAYATVTRNASSDEIVEMGLLKQAGAVAFTNGRSGVANAKTLSRALKYAIAFDGLIVQHPEEATLANGGVMQSGELATRLGLPGIPSEAETIMIDRDLALVRMTGGRYHVAHVSTTGGVASIRAAKAAGLKVTCDTAPPYFALNELAVGEYRTFAKLSPPLRTEEDRQAVVAGLADGTIDCIASDHLPQDQEAKRLPFEQAEFGAAGLESLLALTLELVHNKHLSLSAALAKVTARPAELLNLPLGRLKVGGSADIVIFDPERPTRIEPDSFTSKSKNSPFDGRLVQGCVIRTIVDGRTIYTDAS